MSDWRKVVGVGLSDLADGRHVEGGGGRGKGGAILIVILWRGREVVGVVGSIGSGACE